MNSQAADQGCRVAVLGCGFMGTALLAGILSATQSEHGLVSNYIATVKSEASISRVKKSLAPYDDRVEYSYGDNLPAVKSANIVILAVPPGDLENVLETPGISGALKDTLIISIVAGKSCQDIAQATGITDRPNRETCITRVIPSIGAQIGESMSLVAERILSKKHEEFLIWLFTRVGKIEFVPESLLNTATAASATCHALVASAMDAMVDGSVAEGIPREKAIRIAAQCMKGSSSLLLNGTTIEEFKASMSVPYGITINATLQLDRGGLRPAISDAVRAASKYANDMT